MIARIMTLRILAFASGVEHPDINLKIVVTVRFDFQPIAGRSVVGHDSSLERDVIKNKLDPFRDLESLFKLRGVMPDPAQVSSERQSHTLKMFLRLLMFR